MNPILDIAKIKKWITNDTVLDHAQNIDKNEISVPYKKPLSHFPPPKIFRTCCIATRYVLAQHEMTNIGGRIM